MQGIYIFRAGGSGSTPATEAVQRLELKPVAPIAGGFSARLSFDALGIMTVWLYV
jgi:hypothetical protein